MQPAPEVPRMRPALVIVTGEPGSGKTSLGIELSSALRVPFLSRDHVRGGLLATRGLWTNQLHDPPPREAAVDAFVEIVETVARLGVSAIVEFVVTPPRVPALRRLEAAADCLMIETVASHAAERAAERDRHDPFLIRTDVLEALGHRSIDDYIAGPERAAIRAAMLTDFDLPRLRVTTDDGYDPELAAIVDWTIEQRRR